ncbi:MAG: acyl-CoA desaturase [Wenzhouxiangellaceae bacterium]
MNAALKSLIAWFDNDAIQQPGPGIDWLRVIPYVALHLGVLAVFWVGVSPVAVLVALLMYLIRMFAITAFYHRYFSHRTFKTSRTVQFLFAFIGATAAQRGPLWWAAHHRHHHRHADTDADPHSPRKGFWLAHTGWFLDGRNFATRMEAVKDLARWPELRLLDRFDALPPLMAMVAMYALGEWLQARWPETGTNGWQLLVWGYVVSTVVLYHATFTINSLAHRFGRRRYATPDDSRNNFWLALLCLGEGWHNNHHHFPGSARQGFYWWEIDPAWYGLKLMSWLGLVRDLKPVPERIRAARREAARR